MSTGSVIYPDLSYRTRVTFLINYFQHRFQRTSPQEIQQKFLHAVQEPKETIEEWGHRLDTIVAEMRNFDMQLFFEDYIAQWIKGVRNARN